MGAGNSFKHLRNENQIMDFIDWCHHVLQTLEQQRFHPFLSEHELLNVLFGESAKQSEFHFSKQRHGMLHALDALSEAGLAEEGQHHKWTITPPGRKVLSDPTDYWSAICQQEIDDPEEAAILKIINRLSPQQSSNPDAVWLEEVGRDPILAEFSIDPPELRKSNEHMAQARKYIFDLPKLLADRNFLKIGGGMGGYNTSIKPTYQGLVWETRRGFTIESKFIDDLVKEWETTNVDFKRRLGLDTQKEKAEFAKDALGLVTTKSSGRRYMIVGFDDKTRQYHAPPDPTVTPNRMEQVLANLTAPVVTIRYEIVDCQMGKVGKLELIREPEKLPYRAAQDVFDEKRRKALEKDKVYVRHGSQTESPTDAELEALKEEGRRARGE
jgi:hypothetical protein